MPASTSTARQESDAKTDSLVGCTAQVLHLASLARCCWPPCNPAGAASTKRTMQGFRNPTAETDPIAVLAVHSSHILTLRDPHLFS